MANIDFPRGLAPYGELLRATLYQAPSAVVGNVSLFIGDPVILTGTGNQVDIATAGTGNPLLGAILATYDTNMVPTNYHLDNGGAGYILVADHPDQLFVAQGDGDTSIFSADDAGGNVNLVATAAGSTVNYRSGWELDDSDTGGATAGDQVRLMKVVPRPDNTVGLAHCDWIVRINNHQQTAGIVGVGV